MMTFKRYITMASLVLALFWVAPALAKAPWLDPCEDAAHLGPPGKFLFWTPEQQVAGYRNIARVFPTRVIAAGGNPYPLPLELRGLDDVAVQFDGRTVTADDYFVEQNVAGLLVIRDGRIVYERYGLGNGEHSLWVSFSVAKSVTSMLIGAAIQDGYIESVDENISDYLPRLRHSAYDRVSLRNALQMSSGVAWNEDYADPASDVNSADWTTLGLYQYLRNKPRQAQPGDVFNYNTAETNLVGTLLRAAIGNNLSTYLSEKIWKPFGMESAANWLLSEAGGGESGGCCISATLRDYGRLGLFALHQGQLPDGTRVLPADWMREATTPSKANPGYGYFWWLSGDGAFEASGIFGQAIYVNPKARVVIAQHSARAVASKRSDWMLQKAFFAAVVQALDD